MADKLLLDARRSRVNSVHLPDEYDRINIDLAPFRAMSSSLLRSRLARIQTSEDTFTLSVKNGHVDTNHITYDSAKIGGSDDRRNGQVELIRSVARWIPDFDAVYSIHDSPTRFISDAHLEDLKILAEDGECESALSSSCLTFLQAPDAAFSRRPRPNNRDGHLDGRLGSGVPAWLEASQHEGRRRRHPTP